MSDIPDRRCGSCARFVRVHEVIDENGEVKRVGQCLLGVWPSPLYASNTCSQYVLRGTFTARPAPARSRSSSPRGRALPLTQDTGPVQVDLPEELMDMDADEFRAVLRDVLREELGVSRAPIGPRWSGGELVLVPGKEGTQEKRLPIEAFFAKVVMIRDRLRVLEQKVNAHPGLSAEDKVQLQQYVTACYGSLTTFNVLFANREDNFVGQKGARDD